MATSGSSQGAGGEPMLDLVLKTGSSSCQKFAGPTQFNFDVLSISFRPSPLSSPPPAGEGVEGGGPAEHRATTRRGQTESAPATFSIVAVLLDRLRERGRYTLARSVSGGRAGRRFIGVVRPRRRSGCDDRRGRRIEDKNKNTLSPEPWRDRCISTLCYAIVRPESGLPGCLSAGF